MIKEKSFVNNNMYKFKRIFQIVRIVLYVIVILGLLIFRNTSFKEVFVKAEPSNYENEFSHLEAEETLEADEGQSEDGEQTEAADTEEATEALVDEENTKATEDTKTAKDDEEDISKKLSNAKNVEFYPYRDMLNKAQQSVYDQILINASMYMENYFTLDSYLPHAQMDGVMAAIYYDHPELFWLETEYSYYYYTYGTVTSIQLTYNSTLKNIKENRKAFNEKVEELLAEAMQYETDIEKEKFVHDYIANNTTYNEQATLNQSAFSAMVNEDSVCAGYSRAFQYIMMRLGIPCYYVAGEVSGEPHAWNMVKLDGEFYNIDVLWDDIEGEDLGVVPTYTYFNIPDWDFGRERYRVLMSLSLPDCTKSDKTYEEIFGESPIPAIE